MLATCANCLDLVTGAERFVLVQRRREQIHCSRACLLETLRRQRRAQAARRNRWLLRAAAAGAVAVAVPALWHRVRVPHAQTIAFEAPQVRPMPRAVPPPIFYGPAWPPTDQDWMTAFASTSWVYPLPGPAREAPAADDRILTSRSGPSASRDDTASPGPTSSARAAGGHPGAVCHTPGRCAVDLTGRLWGEHVYAVHDGVVDHLQRTFGERGDVYLRLSHFGGMVFTHYLHLAAVPRNITRGTVVRAGDVIGLVGDTGNEHAGHYVHFALSVRPSADLPEVYWDPTELMAKWPMRLPPHGTVAGFVPPQSDLAVPSLHRRPR